MLKTYHLTVFYTNVLIPITAENRVWKLYLSSQRQTGTITTTWDVSRVRHIIYSGNGSNLCNAKDSTTTL